MKRFKLSPKIAVKIQGLRRILAQQQEGWLPAFSYNLRQAPHHNLVGPATSSKPMAIGANCQLINPFSLKLNTVGPIDLSSRDVPSRPCPLRPAICHRE